MNLSTKLPLNLLGKLKKIFRTRRNIKSFLGKVARFLALPTYLTRALLPKLSFVLREFSNSFSNTKFHNPRLLNIKPNALKNIIRLKLSHLPSCYTDDRKKTKKNPIQLPDNRQLSEEEVFNNNLKSHFYLLSYRN